MKKIIVLLALTFLLSCEKKTSPFEGNWSFQFFGCYNFDTEIDTNGDFTFHTTVGILNPAGIYDYVVVGNINDDGEVTGTIHYENEKVGTLNGNEISNVQIAGSYSVVFIGPTSCFSSVGGDPFWWQAVKQ